MGKKKAEAPLPEYPYAVRDAAGFGGEGKFGRLWVVGRTFLGYRVVYRHPNVESQLGVKDRVIYEWQMRLYPRIPLENSSLQSLFSELKMDMLDQGATPLAVQWVGDLSPFSEKELKTMADKLTKKTAAKPAAKATAAAKPAKAAKEPKAPAADKTYKHLMTPAKAAETVRAGTWTARMVEIIMGTKSTAEARGELAKDKTYADKSLDFGWAAKKGLISTPA